MERENTGNSHMNMLECTPIHDFPDGGIGMKQIRLIILIILLALLTTGCEHRINLHQPLEEINHVELVYSPFGENQVLYTLESDEIESFFDSFLQIKLHKHLSPQDVGGSLIVRIVYSDDSVELLGTSSICYETGEELIHDGWYYLSHNDLYSLFSQYIDLSILPYI